MRKIFRNKKVVLLTGIMIIVSFVIASISIFLIYNNAKKQLYERLTDIANQEKSEITIWLNNFHANESDIIELLGHVEKYNSSIGVNGEIVIAQEVDDSIEFIISRKSISRHYSISKKIPLASPMYKALKGETGCMKAKDYNNDEVFAAYTFVKPLKFGIVAKIPTAEINKPYIFSAILVLILTIIFISICSYAFFKITTPLINSLLESEGRFRMAIMTAPFPIMIHAEDGEVITINEVWTELTGYSHKEIPTIPDWTEKAYQRRSHVVKENIDKLYFLDHKIEEGEFEILTANRKKIIWDFGSAPLGKFNDGRRLVISMAKDVTESKRIVDVLRESEEKYRTLNEKVNKANRELQERNNEYASLNEEYKTQNEEFQQAKENAEESEKRFRSIIENTEAGYFYLDNNGLFQNVNRAWLRLYKFDDFDEVIGKHFAKVQQIDDLESANEFVEGIRNSNPAYMNGYFSRKCKDGSIGYHSFSARPIKIGNVALGIEGFIIDITQLKNTEAELIRSKELVEESEKHFRLLFENMEQGFALHEMIYENNAPVDYRFVNVNKAFERLTGLGADELIGKTVKEVIPSIEDLWINNYGKVAQTGVPLNFENYSQGLDKYYQVVAYSPKKDYFAVIFTDVTQTKEFQKELIAAKEKAEENDRLKSVFLANMSHEVRTPMNAIIGFSECLMNSSLTEIKRKRFTNIIKERTYDLLRIVEDILDVSKIEAKQMQFIETEFVISELMYDLHLEYLQKIQDTKGKSAIQLTLSIPETLKNITITTDNQRLKQVITNLLNNAFKFTPKGIIEFGYNILETQDPAFPQLQFFVKDTGIGIPFEKQELIFDRFRQADEALSGRLYGGAGLGLAIAKGIVTMMNGKIWLESKVNEGTVFYLTVPFKHNIIKDTIAETVPSEHPSWKNKTILIVEDDESNIEYLKEVLIDKGLNCMYAENGEKAMQIFRSNPFINMVLMDIRLPDINGLDLTRMMKKENPKLVVIAQTAYASPTDKVDCIDAGCNDYISKPMNRVKLLSLIGQYLNKHK